MMDNNIGNKNTDNFTLACSICGTDADLTLTAHRNTLREVTGWIVACNECQPGLGSMNWKLERLEVTNEHR